MQQALCGFGWMSDNSALNCIGEISAHFYSDTILDLHELMALALALILPRVQVHFDLSSRVVGLLSASTMAGVSSISLAIYVFVIRIHQAERSTITVDDDRCCQLGTHI